MHPSHPVLCGCVLDHQAESKDEAEKPSESAEKADKVEGGEKVKKESTEASEREEGDNEAGDKTAAAGRLLPRPYI